MKLRSSMEIKIDMEGGNTMDDNNCKLTQEQIDELVQGVKRKMVFSLMGT